MNILKAINALSSPSAAKPAEKSEENAPAAPPAECAADDGHANIMAQAIMRHESIANRVHSRQNK